MSQGVRERELKHSFSNPLSFKRQAASFMIIYDMAFPSMFMGADKIQKKFLRLIILSASTI